MIAFRPLGITFVKSSFIWQGRFPSAANNNPDSLMTAARGTADFTTSREAQGFPQHWFAYVSDGAVRGSDRLEATAAEEINFLLLKFFRLTGFNPSVSDVECELWSRDHGDALVYLPLGTNTFSMLDDLFRFLVGSTRPASGHTNSIKNISTWTGTRSDYNLTTNFGSASTDILPTPASGDKIFEAIQCNRFEEYRQSRDRALIGRILPGRTEIEENLLYATPRSLSEPVGGAVQTIEISMRYPPLYADAAIRVTPVRQRDPNGSGYIEILDPGTQNAPVGVKTIVKGEATTDRDHPAGIKYDVRVIDGTGTEDYTRPFVFEIVNPDEAGLFSRPRSITVNVTAEESGRAHLVLTANVAQISAEFPTASVSLYLSTSPPSPVTVSVGVVQDPADLGWTVTPASFTFTSANWNSPQRLTVDSRPVRTDPPEEQAEGLSRAVVTLDPSATVDANNPYKTAAAKTVTFVKNRNVVGTTPRVGTFTAQPPGGRFARVSGQDNSVISGKYYVEELERDLIADTITVSVRGASYQDGQLDQYIGKETENGD